VTGTEPAGSLIGPWRDVHEVSDHAVQGLVTALSAGGVPVPVAGHEVDDGAHMIDLAWPDQRVAVVIDEDADRDAWLADNGWAVVGTEETTVRAALSATGAGA
jgi:hypothetical protein